MNQPLEPDRLRPSFSRPEKRASSFAGLLVAGAGLLVLLLFYLFFNDSEYKHGDKTAQQEAEQSESDPRAEKARQKELIAYLQQHPDDEFAHFQLGQLIQKRAPFQALENFSHVTAKHPHYYEALEAIADIAREQNLPDKARPALLELVREYPEEPRFQQQMARLLLATGDANRALSYASRSIELGSRQAADYLLVAEILRQAGRTGEMLGPLKEALFLDPANYDAHLILAYASLYMGDLQTAEREANWCLKRHPGSSTALRYLAQIDRSQGKIDQALSHIEQALQVAPRNIENLLLKADLLIYQRDGQQAYDLLKPLYAEQAQNRRYISALARAAGLIGNRDEVLQLQQQNQALIKAEDLKPSSLQSESVEQRQSVQQQ